MTEYTKGKIILTLEQLVLFPFILLGYFIGFFKKNPFKKSSILFLLRNADLGGSTTLHLDIIQLLKKENPFLVFTKRPGDNQFFERFKNTHLPILDIHSAIDNKFLHVLNVIYRGIIINHINHSTLKTVVGAECLYFYKLLPYLKKDIYTIDITHVNKWQHYTIRFIDYIDLRVYSSIGIFKDAQQQYQASKIDTTLVNHLKFIEYKTDFENYREPNNDQLKIIFIGRGSAQKRVHIVGKIAQQAHALNLNVHFSFVGDVSNILDVSKYSYCTFYGNITDKKMLSELEQSNDVLLLTSAFEGLPLVVMEMMAKGRVVMTTAVSSLPDYINHKETGILLYAKEEDEIVKEAIQNIQYLITHYDEIKRMGKNARTFALECFHPSIFENEVMNSFVR